MKKLLTILLSLFLVLGAAAAETAEEMKELVVNWEDASEMAANYEGDFVSFGNLGLVMFVPSSFTALEVDEESLSAGVITIMRSEELGGNMVVAYQNLGDMDFDAFVNELKSAGADSFEKGVINGLPVLSYDLELGGVKTTNLVFEEGETNIITFSFAPIDNETFRSAVLVMCASIKAGE